MIEIMPESSDAVLAVKATGILTDADYKDIWIPRMEKVIKEFGKVKVLLYMTEDVVVGNCILHGTMPYSASKTGATLKKSPWLAQDNGWNGVLNSPRT